MTRAHLSLLSLTLVGLCTLFSAQAYAQDSPPTLDLSIGVKGGMNGSWATEVPEDSRFTAGNQEYVVDPEYYPLFGLGGDFGLALELRAFGLIGLETGVRFSFDNGKGWNDKKDANSGQILARVNQEQSSTSIRVPLFLKLSGTSGLVRPYMAVGFEFVNQSESSLKYSVENRAGSVNQADFERLQARNLIEPSSYTGVGANLGIEINLGFIKIPIELRGLYNLNYDESFNERIRVEGDNPNDFKFIYNGGFQGHFGFTVGLLYNYELYL